MKWQYVRLRAGTKTAADKKWQERPLPAGDTDPQARGVHVGASGLLVVDEDAPGAVDDWLRLIERTLPTTYSVTTASGKRHLYFTFAGSATATTRTGIGGFKVDLLAGNRYAVAPGSMVEGRAYVADDPNAAIAPAPEWLVALVAARDTANASAAPTPGTFMDLKPWQDIPGTLAGGRNHGVHALASALRGRGGWHYEDALAHMDAVVWPLIDQTQSGHEFTRDEYEKAIASAWNYEDGAVKRAADTQNGNNGSIINGDPSVYFSKTGGLKVAALAAGILKLGPLADGGDNRTWGYNEGVWRPAPQVVRERTCRLLGDRYRRTHGTNVEDMARTYAPRIACEPVEQYINFRNGLLDWRTGTLHEHTPEVLSTVQLATSYDPNAVCPTFDKYLAEVVAPDVIPLVWELIGYMMYSGNPLHKAVLLVGTGRNGKGTLLRAVKALLGEENTASAALQDIVNNRFATSSLFGKIANIAGDIDAKFVENTAIFKAVTGGDQIRAEHKHCKEFRFTPWAVPVFSANKIPASADTSVGYLSRWVVVPFPHSFLGREDRTLDGRLHDELPGVAAKAVRALPRLLDRGDFLLTDSTRDAREDFVRRVDQVATWAHECADIGPAHEWTPRTAIYDAYGRWARQNGHKPVRSSEFYDRLETAGAMPGKDGRGQRGFRGIRVTDPGWWAGGVTAGAP